MENKYVENTIEKIVWLKLVEINKELHDRDDWDGMDTEGWMSEMIGKHHGNFTEQMEWELKEILFYHSHSLVDETPSLEGFNKLFDNLTEEEWNFYIDCILNY